MECDRRRSLAQEKTADWLLATKRKNGQCYKIRFKKGGEKLMAPAIYSRFIHFLQEDLAISADALAVALRHREQDPGPLPMILWQYGLITLEQLDQIYDWLETV